MQTSASGVVWVQGTTYQLNQLNYIGFDSRYKY